ncbi:SHOCT domain-containing protein [Sinorhizobium meliloti]|uniref:SHOCT domain-containing protein n=5 Tax=Sinorhizobium TaxID=28105 RepID=Q92PL8_RHIME|nr:Hypothetical protein SM2011_c00295 [Sinorhizobium meliloti 2011]ARS71975.1 hypothetical protein SMRU11_34440 [Sinorhizobium meliloti RU11/001]ASJ59447.1 hypothetical protein SMB554_09730 [Sinorhizobium meliloti]PST25710.1 hypothetical protein C7U62_13785 [Mesorhizobium loti]CAC46303.2 Hypothetical protein SMc00295 [Sinorhizobium meliloti 1021]
MIVAGRRTKTCSRSKCYSDLCASQETRGAVAHRRAAETEVIASMLAVGKQRSLSWMSALILAGVLAGCNSTADLATYPSVYGQKPAAMQQMTSEEALNMQGQLTALAGQRRSGAISEAEYQRRLKELQLLAEQHGADTLKQIEN